MNVLVIENDPSDRKLMGEALKTLDHVVREGASAEEALVAIVADKPDVIVLDVSLPGMGALTFARLLKDYPDTRQIPIVAVTAFPEPFQSRDFLAAGCDACITKSVDARELARQLKTAAERKQGTEAP